jgi:ABC-2 type transport system ATP-binding protein
MPAIEIKGLSKDYVTGFWRAGVRRVLDGLSLEVEKGEVFGFLGHNGAGKTTTLKLLTGMIFPTEGSASILGYTAGTPDAFYQTGYLPENPYFYDYLTPNELLDYFGRFFNMNSSERRARVETVLQQVHLTDFRHTALRKFSKGMLQRVGIAQALLHDPQIVLLDEPMSGLDPVGRRDVRNLIQQMRAQGKTIFFSTHILSDAESLCDRVAILGTGKLMGVGKIADLLRRESGYEAILECNNSELLQRLERISGAPTSVSGGHVRLEIPESGMNELHALCTSGRARLLSLTPLQISLEEYFVELLEKDPLRKQEGISR